MIPKVSALLLGGGMANTFLLAQGHDVGLSLAEPDLVPDARTLLDEATERHVSILTPSDVVIAASLDDRGRTVAVDRIPAEMAVYDIGQETVQTYSRTIAEAKTVFWNGPMGVFERDEFRNGTLGIARALADSEAFSVVGGGDSLAAIAQAGVGAQIDHLSTGGGASLEFVEGRILPGIAALGEDGVST